MEGRDLLWLMFSLITLGFGLLLRGYLGEKGKNLATKEDVAEVTRLVENVRGAVSSDLWARQERWKLKRDVYLRILEDLFDGLALHNGMIRGLTGQLTLSEAHRTLGETIERSDKNVESVRRTFAVSGLLLNGAAQTALREFETAMAWVSDKPNLELRDVQAIAANFSRTHKALIEAAKDDLAAV